MRRMTWQGLALAAAATASLAGSARADDIANFGAFGNTNLTFGGFVTIYGDGGSNADIDHTGAILTADDLYAVGNFDGTSASQSVSGAVVLGQNFYGGELSTYGSIDAGGDVALQGNVTGNVTAGGDLSLTDFNDVGGNALANGNANLAALNTIGGTLGANGNISSTGGITAANIVYGGTINLGGGSSYGTLTHGTVLVQPRTFSAIPFDQTSFTSGTGNLAPTGSLGISPGSYGSLTLNGGTITLSSGNYYFSSIQSAGFFTTFNYNLTNGPINIFVTGDVDLLAVGFQINGQSLSSLGNSAEALASEIYLESHGNITFDNVVPANGSQFFGTLYAPDGAINTGVNETFYGGLIGQTVDIGGANIYSEPSQYLEQLVPEPASLIALLPAVMGLSLRRRR